MATIVAASASYAHVAAAIALASANDTVTVPAGSATWASKLTITKGINLIGAGAGSTIITNGYTGAAYNDLLIVYQPSDFTTDIDFRISGFTFELNALCGGGIFLNHSDSSSVVPQTKIRIDHNVFHAAVLDFSPQAIKNSGMRGVIDNNTFNNFKYPIRSVHTYYGPTWWDNWGDYVPGTSAVMYYEDNTFNDITIITDSQDANSYAFRYNTINQADATGSYPLFDLHGNSPGSNSSRGGEIYGNQINSLYPIDLIDQRGGRMVVFGNNRQAASGTPEFFLQIRDEYGDLEGPQPTTGVKQYPNKSYFFLNAKNLTTMVTAVTNGGQASTSPYADIPTENREYWVGNASFDGTVGVGYGTLAARPATCTTGVGYWATNQSVSNLTGMIGAAPATPISGTLYRASATNTWEAFYTPYTYPHPLRGEGVAPDVMTVVSPNGGESWVGNSVHNITWTNTGDTVYANVKIEYSTNSGLTWTTIIASTPNTGSYTWTVPNTAAATYMIKVTAVV
jgi:hypothetical protein